MIIKIKRIYEPYLRSDGYRVLVDRLWPRGIRKESSHADVWMKEVGPSTALRKWFNHDPAKWREFLEKYRGELKASAAFEELVALTNKHKLITLLYASKDEEYNQAEALKQFLTSDSM